MGVVFELSGKIQNMQMCVQGCHFLRFLKKKYAESRRRPICSSYAKGHQNRSSSFAYFLRYIWSKTRNMHMRAAFPHFLRFLKKNTPSHVRDQYVVRMQKGIKIGPVVWPLTRSFSHFLISFLISSRIAL